MKPLKVLHLLGELKHSGAEVQLNLAAPYLINEEMESHIIAIGDSMGDYAGTLVSAGYHVTHIRFEKSLSYFQELYTYLKQEKFDAIHIHAERAFFYHAFIAKLAGIRKIIRTVRNVFMFSGSLRLRRMLQRFVAAKALNVRFVSVSKSVAEVEKKYFFNTCIHIPNWTSKNKVYPGSAGEKLMYRSSFNINPNAVVMVSVGACTAVKNHTAIIDALAMVRNDVPGLLYLHVGQGELLEEEVKHARNMGVDGSVRFCGQAADIRRYLVASDFFVMPSMHEGLPMACVEAMMCGLPIVVYNNYGLKDLIDDGINGIAVENDLTAFAAGIKTLGRDTQLRVKMGDCSLKKIHELINMDTSVRSYLALYKL